MGILKKNSYKSPYKGVSLLDVTSGTIKMWRGNILKKQKYFETEKQAAKWVDLVLIEKGKEPVNIMKRA